MRLIKHWQINIHELEFMHKMDVRPEFISVWYDTTAQPAKNVYHIVSNSLC